MLIICDYRLPVSMHQALAALGSIVWFRSNAVYKAIEGHPDIFMCRIGDAVLTAPNLPAEVSASLTGSAIAHHTGTLAVGNSYPATAPYNALAAHGCFIHNLKITDPELLRMAQPLRQIHVAQGYTRCNLLPLTDGSFITSDRGILSTLQQHGIAVFYVDPAGIVLPGHAHGFIGGTAGWCDDRLVFAGNPLKIQAGAQLADHLTNKGIRWLALADEPLSDVGGLFFF